MTDERDDVLGPWCDALAARHEQDIARYAAVPDFADVLARMQPDDADVTLPSVDDALDDDADDVVPLARARALSSASDPALSPFVAALRERIEHGLHERTMAAIPSTPSVARPRRMRWAATAVLAVAAAGVLWMVAAPRVVTRNDARRANAAVQSLGPAMTSPAWQARAADPIPPRRPTPAIAPVIEPAIEPDPAPVIEPPEPPRPVVRTPAPSKPVPEDLDTLERDADAAWAAGDLEATERALRRVIALGGRAQRVELAYGDLFAVARQRHGSAGQLAVWREYLGKFPTGRFADDARAGVCRSGKAEIASECWQAYVEAYPDGSHVAEARRRLAGEGAK